MKHWLIIYDIRDAKRLQKTAKTLESIGTRVQYSVFEAEISIEKLAETRKTIQAIIQPEDFIIYFQLCQRDWEKRQHFAAGPIAKLDESAYRIL